MTTVYYGKIPVPWPVMWSTEEQYFPGRCPYFKVPAICQNSAHGKGVPRFGRPHLMRQRKVMFLGLCDVCGKPLKRSTKISLSMAPGVDPEPGTPWLQVEPLLHVECAKLSIEQCPRLMQQIERGVLRVRKVFQHKARAAFATPENIATFLPDYIGRTRLIGLATLEIKSWEDVTEEWGIPTTRSSRWPGALAWFRKWAVMAKLVAREV